MKLKDLRQKYNGLLEKLIRLFTLSGVMFTVTACYGVAPYEHQDYINLEGQVLGENNEPLKSIQVVIKKDYALHNHCDTLYTNEIGVYHKRFAGAEVFGADEFAIIANDTSNVYASDTLYIEEEQINFVRLESDDDFVREYYTLDADFQLKKK